MPGGSEKMLPLLHHQRAYHKHRQKLGEAQSRTDSSPPKPQIHLQLRLKQYQIQEERFAIIDRDNRLLKNKMEAIMLSNKNSTMRRRRSYEGKSLNADFRNRQRNKILLENLAIAGRIERTRPVYRVNAWEAQYQKQKRIADSWRKKNSKYRVYALPNQKGTDDAYESDFESDNNSDSDDDQNRQKRKGNRLPPIKAGQQQERGNDTRRSRPNLWMYYGTHPFSEDEDEDASPRDGKKRENDEDRDKADRQAESDAKQLFKVAKELAPSHDIIIKTLAKKYFYQRMKTKDKFRELYDLDLETELKKGLGSEWTLLIECLLNDQNEGQSEGVCKSMKSGDPVALVKKLTPLSNQELADLKEEYYKENSSNLESDISKKFTVPTETLLLTLVKGSKKEKEHVNEKQAEKDAKALFEFGNGRFTSNKGKFIRLLEDRTPAHMNSVFNCYKNLNKGKPVTKSVQEECTKDYTQVVNAYVSATETASSGTADNLRTNCDATNPVFVKTVVARSETDIHIVRKGYKKKYGSELVEDLEERSDHTTVPVLRVLIEKHPNPKHSRRGRNKGRDEGDRTQRDEEEDETQQKEEEPKQEEEEKFDPDKDAEKLYNAMKNLGTNEEDIIKIIPQRTQAQRQQIKAKYQEKYKKDLMKELDSELSGDFGDAILGLMMPPVEYDAHCLKQATKGFGTNETTLIGIICSKNDAEMANIKKAYKSAYKKDLEADVKSDTSGDFKDLLLTLIADEDKNTKVDQEKAKQDAKTLEEESSSAIFREVFIVSTDAQMNATIKAYKDLYKKDITELIKEKTSGDLRDGYLARVKASGDMTTFYAERLRSSMQGVGTNEAQLTRILITTSEGELPAVSSKYKELYGTSLKKDVESETSGDYQKTLLMLLKHHGGSDDDKAKKQKKDEKGQKKTASKEQQKSKKEEKKKSSEPATKEKDDKHDQTKTGRRDNNAKDRTMEQKEKDKNEQKQKEADQKKKESEQQKKEADQKKKESEQKKKEAEKKNEAKNKDEGGDKSKKKQEDGKKKDEKKGTDKDEEDEDAVKLYKAMKGFGTDEKVIVNIIPCRTNAQRQEIKARYKELYSKDLDKELESELSGDFQEVILALMIPSDQYEAECLDDAMKGKGADETAMIGILCSKTPEELQEIKDTYKKNNNKDLADVIAKETKGDFKDVLLQVLKGERDTSSTADKDKAKADAELIGNKHNLNVIKELYSKGSAAQIKATEEAHMKLYNKDIRESIKDACSGDEENLYLALANSQGDPSDFYVGRIYNSMKGFGTNDSQLIRIIVSRSEVDLPAIQEKYEKRYGTSLRKDVQSETSGDYRATLMKLIGGAGKEGGGNKQAKKSESPTRKKEAAPVKAAQEKPVAKGTSPERKRDTDKKKPDDERKTKQETKKKEEHEKKGQEKDQKKKTEDDSKRKEPEKKKKDDGQKTAGAQSKKKNEKDKEKGKSEEDSDEDAVRLYKAMKGFGTNEKVIIDIIPCRTNAERQEIKARYKELYKKDLDKELDSELSGDFREAILALMVPSEDYEAECLVDAMKGKGADESVMIGILCSKSPEELDKLKDTFKKNTKKDLAKEIESESKGDFKDVILQVLKGERDTSSEADMKKAEEDAKLIGNKHNLKVIKELYSKGSSAQIKATEEAHMRLYKKDIRESIKDACSGDEEKIYLALTNSQGDPTDFYVQRIYNSMKGFGTNDTQLIRILVSRSEVDLSEIKVNYEKKFGSALRKDVHGETSGDYRATLLKIIDNAGKGGGASGGGAGGRSGGGGGTKKETKKREESPKRETKAKETERKETKAKETKPKETKPKETKPKEAKPKETERKETKQKVTTTAVVKPVANDDGKKKEQEEKKKLEEEKKKKEEEDRKRKEEERKKKEEDERKKRENEERKKKEEEKKKKDEEERKKREEEKKKKDEEERKKREEEKKKKEEEERKKREEEKKKKEEDEKKKAEEEKKRKDEEERKKKEEEKKKKEEEERKRQEEEKKKKEAEALKKKEEEKKQKEQEEKKKQEEQKKKQEEEKKKADEEKKRKEEEEKKKKEEEEKKKKEEEEKKKREEEEQKKKEEEDKKKKEEQEKNAAAKEEKQDEKHEEGDSNEDAVRLYKAMKGLGTDEKVIIDIIPCRTNAERQGIKARYQVLYKKDLNSDLKSELSGDLEETVTALMMPPVEYDAYCLHEALSGAGTDESTLVGVICSKTPAEMEEIRKAYRTAYSSELETDIEKDTKGEFGKLIKELAGGLKPSTEVDMAKAEADAKEIHDEPSEECFNRVFTENSRLQMTATAEAHQRLFNQDICESLKRSSDSDAETTYIGLVEAFKDESEFYAKRLNKAMKGLGTNDSQLIRILVSRSEIDLAVIKTKYQELYGHTLREDVESDTSGDYKKLLLKLIDEADHLAKDKKEETPEAKGRVGRRSSRAPTPKSPAENRRAEAAAIKLFQCLEASGTDEEGIVDIISNQPNKERQKTKNKYRELYKRELVSDLSDKLSGDLKEAILAMMMPPLEYEAFCLHEALRGMGTDDTILIGMLTCKKAAELDDIKKMYKKMYSRELSEDIEKDTSGDYRDLLMQLATAQRDQSYRVDNDKADQDAKNVHDEPSTPLFTEVFVKSSRNHVKAVAEAHQRLFKADIVESLSRVAMGDLCNTYDAIVKSCSDELSHYAERLNHAIYGLGTNDTLLIRLIVSKSETDLPSIQVRYRNLFNRSLREDVHNDLSGQYRNALVKLMDK